MDYNKIGKFISNERKNKKLTQAKLAEKLFVSEKTISKWENGNGIPDTNILPKLCGVFDVSINELLNGERMTDKNYSEKAEKTLLELRKEKEESDNRLLKVEIILSIVSLFSIIIILFISSYLMENKKMVIIPVILIAISFLMIIVTGCCCLYIEQTAGYYVCKNCNNKYVPTYKQVFFAPHIGRTRYMKCPKCKKISWQKKILK